MSKPRRYGYKEYKQNEEFKRVRTPSGNLESKRISNKDVAKLYPIINNQLDKLYKIWVKKDIQLKSMIQNKTTAIDQQCQRVSVFETDFYRSCKRYSSKSKISQ